MRKFIQWTLLVLTLSGGAPLFAATATDFYLGLLRRGTFEVEAGRNETAITPLRLAAFGLVESIDHYETAQVYLAIAHDRMQETEGAREAMVRILAAERVERKFSGLPLPAPIRTSFAAVARKVLPSADAALLLNPPATATPATAPATTPATQPTSRPVVEKPAQTKPVPSTTSSAASTPPPPVSKPAPQKTPPAQPRVDVPALLAAGDRAVLAANLAEARRIYRQLLDTPGLDHAMWIRVAEGLYRSRDFAGALQAFERVGTLRAGEEAYRYYIAVALYETGAYERAKRELAGALPYIEITPDVERYRARIEGAR